jgi:myo-inositol-1(or 4)-monophosphatase
VSSTTPEPASAGEHLEVVAIEVAQLAAALVRASFGSAAEMGTKSSPTDVVTSTDLQSERLIRRELIARCPASTIVGEEFDDATGSNAVGWIVDPIDGTVNFLFGIPVVSISIAATLDGQTVAGAVVDVLHNETFSAAVGSGARRDAEPIEPRRTESLNDALVGTGFSYDASRRSEQSAILNRLLPECRDIRCMGSAALNLCWVASGRLDAYYEHDTKPYDYAAGALIAREAGVVVELPADNDLGLTVAAAHTAFDALRSLVVVS